MNKSSKTGYKEPVVKDRKLKADLRKYCQMALDLGADKAIIVSARDISQKLRARIGDDFPRGNSQGACFLRNIVEEIPWKVSREIVASFKYAIISHIPYMIENPNVFTGPTAGGSLKHYINLYGKVWKFWPDEEVEYWTHVQNSRGGHRSSHYKQASLGKEVVKEARKDKHHFAFSGVSGVCNGMCGDAGFGFHCAALRTGRCRFAGTGMAFPCGTAAIMGLDHPGTYAKLGWQNWVHGWSIFPEDYPGGRAPIDPVPARTSTIFIE